MKLRLSHVDLKWGSGKTFLFNTHQKLFANNDDQTSTSVTREGCPSYTVYKGISPNCAPILNEND